VGQDSRRQGVQESWLLFKHRFIHAQDQCSPRERNLEKEAGDPCGSARSFYRNSDAREVYGMWREGQATWEEYRNVVKTCRDATRKAKLHLEFN